MANRTVFLTKSSLYRNKERGLRTWNMVGYLNALGFKKVEETTFRYIADLPDGWSVVGEGRDTFFIDAQGKRRLVDFFDEEANTYYVRLADPKEERLLTHSADMLVGTFMPPPIVIQGICENLMFQHLPAGQLRSLQVTTNIILMGQLQPYQGVVPQLQGVIYLPIYNVPQPIPTTATLAYLTIDELYHLAESQGWLQEWWRDGK